MTPPDDKAEGASEWLAKAQSWFDDDDEEQEHRPVTRADSVHSLAHAFQAVHDAARALGRSDAAARLDARVTSELICIDRGGLRRDGKTPHRLYAVQVLREESAWIRESLPLTAPPPAAEETKTLVECFDCRSTWAGAGVQSPPIPPTCSKCGKPCTMGHWVLPASPPPAATATERGETCTCEEWDEHQMKGFVNRKEPQR